MHAYCYIKSSGTLVTSCLPKTSKIGKHVMQPKPARYSMRNKKDSLNIQMLSKTTTDDLNVFDIVFWSSCK